MTLGSKIRQLRLKRRMTMKETATLIGVSLSTYRDWEYGRKISAEHLVRIGNALGVSVAEFVGDSSDSRQAIAQAVRLIEEALLLLQKA